MHGLTRRAILQREKSLNHYARSTDKNQLHASGSKTMKLQQEIAKTNQNQVNTTLKAIVVDYFERNNLDRETRGAYGKSLNRLSGVCVISANSC